MQIFEWKDDETQDTFYIRFNADLSGDVVIADGKKEMTIPMDALLDFVGKAYIANRISDIVADTTGKELIDILIGA